MTYPASASNRLCYAIYAFEWVLDGSFNSGNSALFISLTTISRHQYHNGLAILGRICVFTGLLLFPEKEAVIDLFVHTADIGSVFLASLR